MATHAEYERLQQVGHTGVATVQLGMVTRMLADQVGETINLVRGRGCRQADQFVYTDISE